MKEKATFYHAGCPVCVSAEQQLLSLINKEKVEVEIVHLGEDRRRVEEAEGRGVKSVPALVYREQVFHINFGASLSDLKK